MECGESGIKKENVVAHVVRVGNNGEGNATHQNLKEVVNFVAETTIIGLYAISKTVKV